MLFFLKLLLLKKKVQNSHTFFAYIFYLLLSSGTFYFFSKVSYSFTPIIGIINLGLYLVFWYLSFHLVNDAYSYYNKIVSLFIIFGLINAMGALVQFFVSPTIFGLTSNNIYGQEIVNLNITKRAISFISSPQSLGTFLSICTILTWIKITGTKKWLSLILLFSSGMLTLSKIYFMTVATFFLINYFSFSKIKQLLGFFGLSLGFIILFEKFYPNNRVFELFFLLFDLENSYTFSVWESFLSYDTSVFNKIFGNGIGVLSRGAQSLGNYLILNGSAESFILQIFFEIGFVGLILFLLLYISAVRGYNILFSQKKYRNLLLAFLPCMFFTPAFYGLTSMFVLSFFLISPKFLFVNDYE